MILVTSSQGFAWPDLGLEIKQGTNELPSLTQAQVDRLLRPWIEGGIVSVLADMDHDKTFRDADIRRMVGLPKLETTVHESEAEPTPGNPIVTDSGVTISVDSEPAVRRGRHR